MTGLFFFLGLFATNGWVHEKGIQHFLNIAVWLINSSGKL